MLRVPCGFESHEASFFRNRMKKQKSIKQTQIMTPRWAVKEMLDMLGVEKESPFTKDETFFFEPSCGDGEFLLEIVERGYSELRAHCDKKFPGNENNKEGALSEVLFKFYAIDIDEGIVVKARTRVHELVYSIMERDGIDDAKMAPILIAKTIQTHIEKKDFFEFFQDEKKRHLS